jgi:hypothetical protein
MTTFDQIAVKIIKEQALIIGPTAWDEARKVTSIHVLDTKAGTLSIDQPNEKGTIDELVSRYEHFFGRAAREVCKEAVASLLADLPSADVPSSLQ